MSAHYHEHLDAILHWSWKLFCRRWCKFIIFSAEEAERREQKRRDGEFAKLRKVHNERTGRA